MVSGISKWRNWHDVATTWSFGVIVQKDDEGIEKDWRTAYSFETLYGGHELASDTHRAWFGHDGDLMGNIS